MRYAVLAFWVVAVVVASGLAEKVTDVQKNDLASFLPGKAESTQVVKLQESFTARNLLPAVVVYERASGLTAADKAKADADARTFAGRTDLVGKVEGPTLSADGNAAQIVVPLDLGSDYFNKAADVVHAMRDQAQRSADGMTVHVTGPAGTTADQAKATDGADSSLLLATIAVVVAILLITYRSPLLWLLPIISAGISLTCAEAVIYLFAKYGGLTVSSDGSFILTILVFGAGTDYALLLVARYREELIRHEDRFQAMAEALRRCGPALLASAATVALSMLCLLFADMNSTRGLGPVFAIGVITGLIVMLTLFPALLVLFGRWIFWPRQPRFGGEPPAASGVWSRLSGGIARRPRTTWVVTALVLAGMALGMTQLNAVGLDDEQTFRTHQDSVAGQQALTRHFPSDAGNPLVVISAADQAGQVKQALTAISGIDAAGLSDPVVKGEHAYLTAPLSDPWHSKAAYATVDRARDAVHAVPGAHALVGGDTALNLDVDRSSRHDRNLIVPIALAVILGVLVLLLRSVVAPLVLVATVALSLAAAIGGSAFLFEHSFGFGAEDPSFPLFVFVFLISLGVDYNIFLMTRVREETTRHGTRRAMRIGLSTTGGVITSAGLVLAGTFAVLGVLPLTLITELGFAVAFGVVLDTFVVRSVLVTALTLDIGRRMWWPSRLSHHPDDLADGELPIEPLCPADDGALQPAD
ncbi:MMPL family transporter [Kitasatospora sp. NPDC056531]|uniref:MMPL family transporter n=1 Tax=Kitasatospora sp. NPDC056531 TaxID=3345856 RepID=UPI0036A766AF